jgi:5-methylcytosine-specific restriction protein A
MPDRSFRFCSWPGCRELTRSRFCPVHADMNEQRERTEKNRYNRTRGSASAQGYDAQWRAARLAYLRTHPLCERCNPTGTEIPAVPATMVHHIVPIKEGGARLDPQNLMALCNACHEVIEGPNRWRRKDETGQNR